MNRDARRVHLSKVSRLTSRHFVYFYLFIILQIVFSASTAFSQSTPVASFVVADGTSSSPSIYTHLSPNGKYLIAGERGSIRKAALWDVEQKKIIQKFESNRFLSVWGAAFSPNGESVLFYGEPYSAALFRVATGEMIYSFQTETPPYPKGFGVGPVLCAAFSPDGNEILLYDWMQWYVVFDARSSTLKRRFYSKFYVSSIIEFLDDKRALVENNYGESKILDTESGVILESYGNAQLAVTPNKKFMAVIPPFANHFGIVDLQTMKLVKSKLFDFELMREFVITNDFQVVLGGVVSTWLNKVFPRCVLEGNDLTKTFQYPLNLSAHENDPDSADSKIELFPDGRRFYTVNGRAVHIWEIGDFTSGIYDSGVYEK